MHLNLRPPATGPGATSRLAAGALAIALAAAACGEPQTVIELRDYVLHQRGNVSTERISAAEEIGTELLGHGWRLDARPGSAAAMLMKRDRSRVWFFSADGATRGVEIRGGLVGDLRRRTRRLLVRLNDRNQSLHTILPGNDAYRIDFRPDALRVGWNVLELRIRRAPKLRTSGVFRVRRFRFLDGDGGAAGRGDRRIESHGDNLLLPAGSLMDAVFELPRSPRLRGRIEARSEGDGAPGPLRTSIELTDESGDVHSLLDVVLEPGAGRGLDVDLEAWSERLVRLRLRVLGSPPAVLRGHELEVVGQGDPPPSPLADLIVPSRPEVSGRLGRGRPGRPDVVLILLDAARADAFSPWGGPYPTPAIEALAAEGTVFERTHSPSSWTGQSMPSIFTGFHPDTLFVEQWGDPLTDAVPTLAELFGASGYRTVLWSQHPLYSRGPTLARGFDEATYSGRHQRERLPAAEDLFDGDRPTFAFVHLLPPHSPYNPPPPFKGRYSSGYDGRMKGYFRVLNRFPKRRDPDSLSAEDLRYVRDRYQDNVAFADHLVGRLLADLRQEGRYDDALIAVMSDHGEAFLEHDRFLHSRRIYEEFLHVPLVVKWPAGIGGFARRVPAPVTLIDLAPTLTAGLALEGAERGFQGVDLLPQVFDGAEPPRRAIYSITRGDGDPTRAPKRFIRWQAAGWSAVWEELLDRTELFHLSEDPGEQQDLAGRHPTLALRLLQSLLMQHDFNGTLLGLERSDGEELDPELAAELEALGYL